MIRSAISSEGFRSRFALVLLGVWVSGLALLLTQSLRACGGMLIYTLDDPYIHMAVAEGLIQGEYGINVGEFAAPCSSILYPFLLAAAEVIGLGMYGPFLLNSIAMAGAVYGVGRIFSEYLFPSGLMALPDKLFYLSFGILFCLCVNAWGLVMTGMEHSLHLLAVVLAIRELLKIGSNPAAPVSWSLIACIVLMPLVRFEGAAMAALVILVLWSLRRRREAVWSSILLIVVMTCWFGFMYRVGLPFFPSSVQLKSSIAYRIAEQHDFWRIGYSTAGNVWSALKQRQGTIFIFMLLILAWRLKFSHKELTRHIRIVSTIAFFGGVAHLLFGRFGWFSRYEIYALCLVLLGCLLSMQEHRSARWARPACLAALILICYPYARTTFESPAASRNIYQQQYQMHRFAVDYWRRPIAVNDLGWVSYRNPNYTLDLYGLGSEHVRLMRLSGSWNAEAMSRLARDRDVGLVMIYEEWYATCLPSSWSKVAVLQTSQVTSAYAEVSFYATDSAYLPELRSTLEAFSETLPDGASLRIE